MFKEIIRKTKNKNEYLITPENIWVRNFVKKAIQNDLNDFWKFDYKIAIENELENKKKGKKNSDVFTEVKRIKKAIIVNDGYDFKNKQNYLINLSKDVIIVGVNGSLAQWTLNFKEEKKRGMNAYLINNPFSESLGYIPQHNYCPMCISSTRTYPDFLTKYKNHNIHYYISAPDNFYYCKEKFSQYKINDYRNPISAAIQILYHLGVNKLMLFGFDDCFKDKRPNSIKVENNLYCYKQQILASNIFDAQFFWLKQKEIKLSYNSSGINLYNAEYINLEDINTFFEG